MTDIGFRYCFSFGIGFRNYFGLTGSLDLFFLIDVTMFINQLLTQRYIHMVCCTSAKLPFLLSSEITACSSNTHKKGTRKSTLYKKYFLLQGRFCQFSQHFKAVFGFIIPLHAITQPHTITVLLLQGKHAAR